MSSESSRAAPSLPLLLHLDLPLLLIMLTSAVLLLLLLLHG
jgi:hypothetical protein